jgi:hypothetical protein
MTKRSDVPRILIADDHTPEERDAIAGALNRLAMLERELKGEKSGRLEWQSNHFCWGRNKGTMCNRTGV